MKVNLVFLLFISLSTRICSVAQTQTPTISNFKSLGSLQKNAKRPLVIFIHTDWCRYCLAMQNKTFADPKVIALLNTQYYFLMLNNAHAKDITFLGKTYTYKATGIETGGHELAEQLARKNQQINFPTTVIIGTNDTINLQIDSFVPPQQFFKILTNYLRLSQLK